MATAQDQASLRFPGPFTPWKAGQYNVFVCYVCLGGGEEGAGVIPMKTNIKFLISPGNMSLKIDLMSDKNKDNIFLTLRLTEQFTAATQLSNTKQEKLGI